MAWLGKHLVIFLKKRKDLEDLLFGEIILVFLQQPRKIILDDLEIRLTVTAEDLLNILFIQYFILDSFFNQSINYFDVPFDIVWLLIPEEIEDCILLVIVKDFIQHRTFSSQVFKD